MAWYEAPRLPSCDPHSTGASGVLWDVERLGAEGEYTYKASWACTGFKAGLLPSLSVRGGFWSLQTSDTLVAVAAREIS
jgi:hypothetical protein